ncbi:MAG: hypothetical protein WD069_01190 [Planctomycetales bacterium]
MLLGLFGALVLTGCAARRDLAIVRCWADWNTLGTPAVYCEKLHHQPPSPARVETFRWMYGAGPGVVLPAEQIVIVETLPAPVERDEANDAFADSPRGGARSLPDGRLLVPPPPANGPTAADHPIVPLPAR